MGNLVCCKCINDVASYYSPINGSDCNPGPDGLAGWTSVQLGENCGCSNFGGGGEEPSEPVDEVLDDAETLGFTESNKRWNSFYSYKPEFMCGAGTRIVTFKGGDIFEHNSTTAPTPYNEFYGVTYPSEIHIISNEAPSNNKIYKPFSQEPDDVWDVDFESPNGQASNLISSDFDTRENIHYSDMMNDTNSPGGLLEGDRMRDATIIAKCRIAINKFTRMFGVNFNIVPSFRSNK